MTMLKRAHRKDGGPPPETFVWRGVTRFWSDPLPSHASKVPPIRPRVEVKADVPHVNIDSPIVWWRIKRYARQRGLTISEAMDRILNELLPPVTK